MGLLLSVLVFSVGVVEAISCYDRFRTGYLPLSYQKGHRHSQTFTDIISRLEGSFSLSGQPSRAENKSDDSSDTLRCSEYSALGGSPDEDEDEDSVASEDTVVPSNHASSNQELSVDDDVSQEPLSVGINQERIKSSSESYDITGTPDGTISFSEHIHVQKHHSRLSRSVSEPLVTDSVITGRLDLCTNSVSLDGGLDDGGRPKSKNSGKKRVRFNLDAVRICYDKEPASDQSSESSGVVVRSRFPLRLRQKKEHLAESMVNTANSECGPRSSSPHADETTKCLRQLAVSEELLSSLEKEARKLLEEELSAKRITNVGFSEAEDEYDQPDASSSSTTTEEMTDLSVSNELTLDDDSCSNNQSNLITLRRNIDSDKRLETNLSGSPSSTERPLEFKLDDVSGSEVNDSVDSHLKTKANDENLVYGNITPVVHDVQFQNENAASDSVVSEDQSDAATPEEIAESTFNPQGNDSANDKLESTMDSNIESFIENAEIKQNKRETDLSNDAKNVIKDDSIQEARPDDESSLKGDTSEDVKSSENVQGVVTERETLELKSHRDGPIVESEGRTPDGDFKGDLKDDSQASNIPSVDNERGVDKPVEYGAPTLAGGNAESVDVNVERTTSNEDNEKVLAGGDSNTDDSRNLIETSTKSEVDANSLVSSEGKEVETKSIESGIESALTAGEDKEQIVLAKGDAHKEKHVSKSARTSRVKHGDSESDEEAETKKTPLRRGAVKSKLVFDRSKGPASQGARGAGRSRRRAMREGSGTESEEEWRVEEASDGVQGDSGGDAATSATRAPPQDESRSPAKAFWLIFSGEYTKAMSKDWHSSHFCCWQCDESLTGQRYVLRDDHPYCIKCYESVFANSCEECSRVIGIDSKDLSYKDKHWHEACFLCSKCRVSLVDKQFGSKADKIYCGNCYDAQFASRCDGCSQIFRAGTKKMEYKTRQWHEQCFCCCVCKSPIGTKSFIPREQEIYCATCYEEKFATRCVKCNKIITSGGVTYKNEPWHRECFTCTNCGTSLAGQRFTSREDKPYCADCFGELFAKRCTACCKPITGIGGTRFISFEDRHWHNDCFICAACKASLVGRGFITDGEDIICPECAKQKLM